VPRNPDTNLGKGHEAAALRLTAETEKQNNMLDQIDKGLDELLEGAKVIGEEVDEQDRRIDKAQNKAEQTSSRVAQMNQKSQLRKYAK
jgi:peptidoglycan hydrolase CwlO-like protein